VARPWPPGTVAVIIPCHNYGRFLGEAIESVLTQERRADEIVVVDDSSTDDTPLVAAEFASQGVQYLRVGYSHSQQTRRAGFLATVSDVVCFLDADDCLAPEYLALGMREFTASDVGIVYSDVEHFGSNHGKSQYPAEYSRPALARMNFIHSGALVLREALEVSRGLDIFTDDKLVLQDWLVWRRVLDCGWQARKQPGLYRYRKHGESMTANWSAWHQVPNLYFQRAGLAAETVTLFVPLSGRAALWPEFADFLERQTWPHDQIRLILLDSSQDAEFSGTVRRWVATCDYPDVRYIREAVANPGIADLPRREHAREVTLAMARIYNRLAGEVSTDYVWIVEDDILPPLDACRRLLEGFDRYTGSVTGAYWSRFNTAYVAWHADQRMLSENPGGRCEIGGNGFGCVVLRSELIRNKPFTASIDFLAYDNAFYHRLPATGLKAKIDWSVECDHRTNISPPYEGGQGGALGK
jgi:GT2 family glycosyltransferase